MRITYATILYIALISILSSCSLFEQGDDNAFIASVGDDYLLLSEIDEITIDQSSEDSAQIASTYIDNWIKEKLLLQTALLNLKESDVNFEKQLENYRNSLLIYAYENELIKQKLDTVVTETQLKRYYSNNQQNFELRQDLLKARVFKYLNSAPKQDSLVYWLKSGSEKYDLKLSEYCAQFAIRCDYDTANWIALTTIKSLLPKQYNRSDFNYQKREINIYQDTIETLIVEVIDERVTGKIAPIAFVKNQIVEIIRNRRRLELISRVKEEIFEEATLKKEYEIFTKK